MNKENLKYVVAMPFVAKVAVDVMFEGVTTQSWWATLPWYEINLVSGSLLVSFLVQDLFSPLSGLRRWVSRKRSPFEIEKVIVNSRGDPVRTSLIALLEFSRAPKSSNVTVFFTPTHTTQRGRKMRILSKSIGIVGKGHRERLVLGSVMIAHPEWTPRHSIWGMDIGPETLSDGVGERGICSGMRGLITIAIDGFERKCVVQRVDMKLQDGDGFSVFESGDAAYLMGVE